LQTTDKKLRRKSDQMIDQLRAKWNDIAKQVPQEDGAKKHPEKTRVT